jgi:hypothetical protein
MTVIAPAPVSPPRTRPAWGPGRVIVLVVGVLLVLGAAALLVGGASLRDIDTSEREDGYLTSDGTDATTSGFALASDAIHLDALPEGWLFGDSRLQVTADDPDHSLFVGIARPDDAAAYLQDIEHTTVTEIDNVAYDHHQGGPPTAAPGGSDIWVAQATGAGPQSVSWPSDGRWTLVVMNSDSSAGVDVSAQFQVKAPHLGEITVGVFAAGVVFATAGGLLLWGTLRRRHQVIA